MERTPIRLEIGVQSPQTKETVWLSYELLDHDFQRKWLAATLRELERRKLWGCRFGALCVDEADYRLRIKLAFESLIKSLPDQKNSPFTDLRFEAVPYIPRTKIENLLKICTSTIADPTSSSTLKNKAESLSDLLRHYVQLYFPEYHYHVSLKTFVPGIFEIPKEADKLFTVDRHDGWLYLDYEGQGLDAMAAFDEQNVVDLEPQTRFSNCAQLLYRDEFDGQALMAKARDWLESTTQSLATQGVASSPTLAASRLQADRLNIGLIPLARPTHGLHRHVVRELFSSTEVPLEFRASKNGNPLEAKDFVAETRDLKPWHPWGEAGLTIAKLLRLTALDIPVGIYLDGYHRFEGLFWFIKKPIQPLIFYVRYQIRTGFHDYRQYARYIAFKIAKPFLPAIYFILHQFQNGFLDARIMAKVYLGRLWTAMTAPIHWARPHAFNVYFKISRPIRKLYYFVSFQFQKRILGRGDKP